VTNDQRRVLIVDDEPEIVEYLQEALDAAGYRTETASSADMALQQIKVFQPHLVLTDHDMPDLTGLEMLRDLRRQENYVTVIFVSANVDDTCVVEALKSGADDYIRKPVRLTELLARIESTLRHNDTHRELFEANRRLQELVDRDHLTGLYNMRTIYDKLDFELRRGKRFGRQVACVMLDMDRFKSVNDNHDHLFGSFVIQQVGELIRDNVREIDFAARYGGDEFLIVLTETHAEGARIFCERLREIIAGREFRKDDDTIRLTASMGFSLSVGEEDARTLVRRADHALYEAKAAGRNRVVEDGLCPST
jgi:two-component system cell cycle response regulator